MEGGTLKFPAQRGYESASGRITDLIQGVLKKEMNEFPEGKDDFLDCLAQRVTLPAYGRMRKSIRVDDPIDRRYKRTRRKRTGVRNYI